MPEWYQRRFLAPGQTKYWYLDLHPDACRSGHATWTRKELHLWGPGRCFAQHDLYTTQWGALANTDIERLFFGRIDGDGQRAIEFFHDFDRTSLSHDQFVAFLGYMSTQKLRTPKGLGLLKESVSKQDHYSTLLTLQKHRDFHCATWAECVWQIADASQSPTKFIISDHPVTVYNRDCFPTSPVCFGFGDPDIRLVATQTIFPLGLEKILILTNLAWVRDPYQKGMIVRPNPSPYRTAMFSFLDVQLDRHLSEDEVIEINYIIKRRALRYLAAGEKEWLYPETRLRDDHWRKLGDGYLLMPDPRHVYMGGQMIIGYDGGHSEAYSEYGHRPSQPGYKDARRENREGTALERFKAEWAAMHGPLYRGTTAKFGSGMGRPLMTGDGEKLHARYLARDAEFRKEPGERRRRRSLKRRS